MPAPMTLLFRQRTTFFRSQHRGCFLLFLLLIVSHNPFSDSLKSQVIISGFPAKHNPNLRLEPLPGALLQPAGVQDAQAAVAGLQ